MSEPSDIDAVDPALPPAPSAPPAAKEPLPKLWVDLLALLAEQYPLIKRTDEWLCLGWPPSNPEQTIQVSCTSAHGLMRVLLTADVCVAEDIKERDALELAAKLLVGGPLIHNGVLSIRHVFTEGRFTMPQLHEAIFLLRGNALRYRERLFRRRTAAAKQLYDEFAY